jgi:hypothetical protein
MPVRRTGRAWRIDGVASTFGLRLERGVALRPDEGIFTLKIFRKQAAISLAPTLRYGQPMQPAIIWLKQHSQQERHLREPAAEETRS